MCSLFLTFYIYQKINLIRFQIPITQITILLQFSIISNDLAQCPRTYTLHQIL